MVACFDVAVAGGGPAGAFAARELARAGIRVILIDPATSRPRLEGMGERVARLLAAKGLESSLNAVSKPAPRNVVWAGLQGTENGERLVRRHEFDAILRTVAVDAGVELKTARLRRVETVDPVGGVELQLSSGQVVTAKLMIDARGRQATTPVRLKGPQTLAISGHVKASIQHTGTHVVATPQGWCWFACDPEFGQWLQVSIAQADLTGSGQTGLQERVQVFLKQPEFQNHFGEVSFQGDLLARGAGLVLAAPELTLPIIPIGDAAVAIDPLSGHGLFWALSSALSAVSIVRTVLEQPIEGAYLARRFYRDRVVGTFWRQARIGRDFYRLEKNFSAMRFWAERAAWPDNEPAHKEAAEASLEQRVVVEDNQLKERDVLITPKNPEGVAFVAGLSVRQLFSLFNRIQTTGERPPAAAEAAFRWLAGQGLSVNALNNLSNKHSKMRETA
ncbi:pilus assembly protein CpaE [Labrenzia sp. PHM005]|nr:pilus assembly protein CpaE [Labrenzia sp. PHM005]